MTTGKATNDCAFVLLKKRLCAVKGYFAHFSRQIGELEPIELVLTLLISDLAAVPMQDFGIPLLNGVIPIVTLLLLSMLLSRAPRI